MSIGMIDDNDTRNLFMERQYAGNLVGLQRIPGATGVTWGQALAMITSNPAQAIGMGGEIGSLAPGRRADLVIWSGDPLEATSAAEAVYIDGVRQPLETHQTRLLSATAICLGADCRRRTGIDRPGRPSSCRASRSSGRIS